MGLISGLGFKESAIRPELMRRIQALFSAHYADFKLDFAENSAYFIRISCGD
jgi:hypothetical protein